MLTNEEIQMLEDDTTSTMRESMPSAMKVAVKEAILLSEEVERREEDLKTLKKRLNFLRTKTLPELMGQTGQDSFTRDNYKFEITTWLSGSWPKDPNDSKKAFEYLESRRAEEIVRTQVIVDLGKGEAELAKNICTMIQHLCSPKITTNVHPQTLMAYARRALKSDEPINLSVLGLQSGLIVKIKRKKIGAV